MRILVTAFDPFGGFDTNSSLIVLNKLPDKVGEVCIDKLMIPTVFKESASVTWEKALETGADAILSLGQAGGRVNITPEKIGINYADASIADNKGVLCSGESLSDGRDAYFSSLPVEKMVKRANEKGFNSALSLSAGAFVCNSLLYLLLEKVEKEEKDIKVGFVHLPYATEQGMDGFSLDADDMCNCVVEMIKVIGDNI